MSIAMTAIPMISRTVMRGGANIRMNMKKNNPLLDALSVVE